MRGCCSPTSKTPTKERCTTLFQILVRLIHLIRIHTLNQIHPLGARKKGLETAEYGDTLCARLEELYELVGLPVTKRLKELNVPKNLAFASGASGVRHPCFARFRSMSWVQSHQKTTLFHISSTCKSPLISHPCLHSSSPESPSHERSASLPYFPLLSQAKQMPRACLST